MSRFCSGDCAGKVGDVLAHLCPAEQTLLSKTQAPGLAYPPWHLEGRLSNTALLPCTGWMYYHVTLKWMFIPHLSALLVNEAHAYSSICFLTTFSSWQTNRRARVVLTNYLFLFRLTGFQSLQHRGMQLFHFAFVFWFLHLFFKANKGKKANNPNNNNNKKVGDQLFTHHNTMSLKRKKTNQFGVHFNPASSRRKQAED